MKYLSKASIGLLYLSVFLIPFYFFRFKIIGLPTNILELSIGLFAVSVIISLMSQRKKPEFGPGWIYLIVLVAFVAALSGDSKTVAFGIAKGWFFFPALLYLGIINTIDRKKLPGLSWPILASLLLISLWAILQKLGVITTLFYQTNDPNFAQYLVGHFRVFGPFESPNYLAMYLVPSLFLTLPLFTIIKDKITKIGLAGLYILPITAIIASGSRAGVIALVFSILVYAFVSEKKQIGSKIISWGFTFTIVLASVMFFIKYGFNPSSDNIRLQIYKYSLDLLQGNWLCGLGLGNFQDRISDLTANADAFRTHALPYAIHPHNIFLGFWLNLGLLGFGLFIGILICFYKTLLTLRRDLIFASLFMAMTAVLTHGLFDSTYFKNDLSAIFWLTLALLMVMNSGKKIKPEFR